MNIPTPPQNADNPAIYADSTHAEKWLWSDAVSKHFLHARMSSVRYCSFVCMLYLLGCMKGIQALIAEISVTSRTDEIFLQGAELAFLSIMEEKQ